ncbi:ABC transporter substrate-binding protein [Prauserella marina]|uniref:Phospholipid/cholesterol/gamma-HCH transport system substrate-binding protein n=1 Tax=Prauserella marina TaxID=530584 RepID=A0A222VL87_9PSEU|nr:MlaD family protein [Prauserella marina]ASR34688.1 ABC transporter substrate-binding protein [Prauserella marina]PWV85653.1 phospholipid/cholesterol/gamma-HCH transport system substrate-binding protein [Prauserella marina]SDC49317.1 phospholipid/cholesterol/gamma-HCH transport system substrate-binding protein [Prauserella marina]
MLSAKIRVQVIAFIAVALAAVALVGANYAGLGRLFGAGGYVVKLELSEAGGIFTNGEVTYRGVAIGRIGELRLTDTGMEADLLIDSSAPPIPTNSRAVVANRSAVGEQYVDLQPRTEDGPYLDEGAIIPREASTLPLPVENLLGSLSDFTESVPTDSLRVVVDEFYNALHGTGPSLQLLLDTSSSLTRTATDFLPQTTALIDDGATVLRTQADSAQAWRSFGSNAKLFAAELAGADGDLRTLIGTAPQAATQLSGLLKDTDPGLSILVANLLTTARLFEARTDGMEQFFVLTPKAVASTSTAITPDGGNLSLALTFFDPLPCVRGYEGTTYRPGTDTSPAPFNTSAACTLPGGDPRSVRGSQNSPVGGVPAAAVPGTGNAPLSSVSTTLEELLWLTK